jgi:hypothetical protein
MHVFSRYNISNITRYVLHITRHPASTFPFHQHATHTATSSAPHNTPTPAAAVRAGVGQEVRPRHLIGRAWHRRHHEVRPPLTEPRRSKPRRGGSAGLSGALPTRLAWNGGAATQLVAAWFELPGMVVVVSVNYACRAPHVPFAVTPVRRQCSAPVPTRNSKAVQQGPLGGAAAAAGGRVPQRHH